jgi:hypothetical protein
MHIAKYRIDVATDLSNTLLKQPSILPGCNTLAIKLSWYKAAVVGKTKQVHRNIQTHRCKFKDFRGLLVNIRKSTQFKRMAASGAASAPHVCASFAAILRCACCNDLYSSDWRSTLESERPDNYI